MNFIFQIGKTHQCAFPFVYAVHDACLRQEGDFIRDYEFCEIGDLTGKLWCDKEFKNWCPVGSIEFVHKWFSLFGIKIPRPVNIPEELFKISNAEPWFVDEFSKRKTLRYPVFIKSMDLIKHRNNGKCVDEVPPGNWIVTDYMEDGFVAEFRAFVFKGFVHGVVQYSGDASIGHSCLDKYIKGCIRMWNTDTPAYTVDVGITKNGTLRLIECHDFYSCGTYGFTGYNILPQMSSSWYFNHINKNK